MNKNKNLLAVSIVLIICLIVIAFSDSIHGSEKKYRIEPEITLPEYQNDLGRVINAYERMMDRLMDINEKNSAGIDTEVKKITKRLASIDRKLTELSKKTARIEKALNIDASKEMDANDSPIIETETP
jgi:predicted  nucleic acid-binding Zn-ribbon protein